MTDPIDADLLLIERWRDSALAPAELAALRARMRDDTAFRARFVDEARFHGMLAGLLADDAPALLQRVESAIHGSRPSGLHRLADTVERRVERTHPRQPGAAFRRSSRPRRGPAPTIGRFAMAAVALVVVTGLWFLLDPIHPAGIAEVVAASGAEVKRAGRTSELRVDEDILIGDEVSTGAGAVTIAYPDGTRIDIAAGSTAVFSQVAAAKRIRFDRGVVVADVAKQPPGAAMELATPHATAVVVGTRFTLSVAGSGTGLAVDEGRVALVRGDERREVAAGETAQADAVGVRAWPISLTTLARDRASIVAAIAPTAVEQRLGAVDWELDLQTARRRAATAGRPLLIWSGWGHPLGMTNVDGLAARTTIVIDPRFHAAVRERFVPVVVDPWMQTRAQDDAGRFFRAAVASVGRRDTTNDGFFVVGVDGRGLAECSGLVGVDEVLATLERGLAADAQRGQAAVPDAARDAGFDHRLPPGGSALAVRARRLERVDGAWRAAGALGRDHFWFSAEDCRALIGSGAAGTRSPLAPALARHIASHLVADSTREEWLEWQAGDLRLGQFEIEVIERSSTRVHLRLTGMVDADDGARSCRVALLADVTADGDVITACEVLAAGDFRDAAGERLIGIHATLAESAAERLVPPHGVRDLHYLRRE